jgi:predicted alpha/beta-hydrolase family hydrolase
MLLRNGPEDAASTLLLAHGAGAPMDSEFMNAFAQGLGDRGVQVVRFEFPYMQRAREGHKRGAPDRMPALETCFRETARALGAPERLFIGGKSMGGRVATRVADGLGVRGVIALGYPFHPPGKPQSLRTEHLEALRTPCLIVQGERDPFGTREEVQHYPLSPQVRVAWLEDGDHSFSPRKRSGRTAEQNLAEAVALVADFMGSLG